MSVRPNEFPPPFDWRDYVAEPSDPLDERIEVGILIVGAGPAGLAAAIRLGQLMEEDPATAERLGEVPVALVEKGKQPGSHLLSGAVVNPRSLRRLFGNRVRTRRPRDRLLHDLADGAAHSHASDDAQRRELRGVALPARALARGAGGGGRDDDPP
jgi:flavin-dependent dehydrogenase